MKEGNILVKNMIETPKKVIYDLKMLDYLTPEELKVHLYLLNVADEKFSPTVRWLQEFLGVSAGKAQQVNRALRTKGLIELMPTEDGRYFVWIVNNVPLHVDRHREFLNTKTDVLHQKRLERNMEREAEILRLTNMLEKNEGDPIEIIAKINELEKSKE